MRTLIVEDDLASRNFLFKLLSYYGECDVTVDGIEAVEAFSLAMDENPYDLICLDIMMPNLDGTKTLYAIREIEKERGVEEQNRVKVVMTTALNDSQLVDYAFDKGCEAYAIKPIDTEKFIGVLKSFGLIK